MDFSDIVGHKEIIRALNKALTESKVGHAYLFLGPPGVGKKTLVKAFARKLLCNNSQEIQCSGCRSCTLFQAGSHPDFIVVTSSGNSVKIEQLRELQRNSYLRPLLGKYKIFFFPDAEQLTEAAANSFLKLLEEPPAGVIFLFTAVRADRILPTIRSRCQNYTLFPVANTEVKQWLQKKGFEAEEALRRSMTCEGCPGKALMSEKPVDDQERVQLNQILNQDLLTQLKFTSNLEKKERQEILMLINDWEQQARQHLLHGLQGSGVSENKGLEGQIFLIEKLTHVKSLIESNVNSRLALESFFTSVAVRIKGEH